MEGKNEKRKERKKVGRNKGRNKRTHTQDDITVARRTAPPPLCLTVVPSIIPDGAKKPHWPFKRKRLVVLTFCSWSPAR